MFIVTNDAILQCLQSLDELTSIHHQQTRYLELLFYRDYKGFVHLEWYNPNNINDTINYKLNSSIQYHKLRQLMLKFYNRYKYNTNTNKVVFQCSSEVETFLRSWGYETMFTPTWN